jgi:hypothetical protein
LVVDDEAAQGHAFRIAFGVPIGMGAGIQLAVLDNVRPSVGSFSCDRELRLCVLAGMPKSELAGAPFVCWR